MRSIGRRNRMITGKEVVSSRLGIIKNEIGVSDGDIYIIHQTLEIHV